nr:thioredoxin-like isoform X2 [Pogona vitticeps]
MEAPIMPQNIHNKKEFEEFLKRAGPRLVVVNFSAKWCGPGKVIRPFVYELAVRYENVLFCIVDVDLAEDVADLCNIVTMPTFQFFMTGEKTCLRGTLF